MERRAARSRGRTAPGWLSPALWFAAALLVIQSLPTSTAVKRHDFKTCDQSGFCRRNRALADRAGEAGASWQSPYEVHAPEFSGGSFRAAVSNALFPQIKFSLELRFQKDGTARVLMDEVDGLRQRYNEAAKWTLVGEPAVEENEARYEANVKETFATIKYNGGQNEARIDYKPLTITFFRDGQPHIVLNERKLFNMEHFRVKTVGNQPEELVVEDPEHPDEQLVVVQNEAFPGFLPPTEDGMWEETFNGKTDSKPKGEEILFLDTRWTSSWSRKACRADTRVRRPRIAQPRHHLPRLRARLRHSRARLDAEPEGDEVRPARGRKIALASNVN